ncbi:MAG: FAD-dependent oxidoreductase, partial [Oscillospiraceae bacterium]|nr:FAD-dependent oxidoreductase [Oscillospiraceae bacterium]
PGAKPTQPRLPGLGLEKLFTLRTVEDTLRIKDYIRNHHPRSAVLAGGGFIGLELAENLRELGLEVTIVQRPRQLMNPFDPDMAAFLHSEVRRHGIRLALGRTVEGFAERDGGVDVLLKDADPLHADLVVLAIGVTPDTALAKAAGLELGLKGSIVVNERMETSAPDIYAVGDAVQVKHFVTGQDAVISLAGPANRQGRIAADNICGGDSRYLGSQGSSVIKVFDLTAASTGVNEANAKKAGLDADAVVLSPMSHAGYYPGGRVMTMKVVFERGTYRLLGAQIVGYEGVDKRIDVLAAAIHAGLTAIQLKDLDLAYAPPYSSAKDPVNMAGFMVENLSRGVVKQFRVEDVKDLPRDGGAVLLDVRTPQEFGRGHVAGFQNIPVDELRDRLEQIEPGKPVYVMCQSGLRSYIACRILAGHGYEAYNFSGGFRFYDAVMNDRRLIERATACGMDQ